MEAIWIGVILPTSMAIVTISSTVRAAQSFAVTRVFVTGNISGYDMHPPVLWEGEEFRNDNCKVSNLLSSLIIRHGEAVYKNKVDVVAAFSQLTYPDIPFQLMVCRRAPGQKKTFN